MKSKHTHWTFVNNFLTTCNEDGSIPLDSKICAEFVSDSITGEHKNLIAAAPDLFKALKGLTLYVDHYLSTDDSCNLLIADSKKALSKATGVK